MYVPEFPESREIVLGDKPLFDSIFAANPPEISAYTFTNIFAWREPHRSTISRVGDSVIVIDKPKGYMTCLEPLGGDPKSAIEEVFRRVEDKECEFCKVHAGVANSLREDPRFKVELDRNNSDYLYLSSDLIQLAGRKYDGKRNHIAQFKSEHNYKYIKMPCVTPEEAQEFADYWCEQRDCRELDGLRDEYIAVYEMLANFDALGIKGGAIVVEGKVVAFSLGESLNPETMVIHVEKAGSQMNGLYQAINNEFAIHEASNCKYINREQDLGVIGLRKAKKSYHPVKMVETYTVKRA
ncbi:MAG: phosphatidylglycerol lysyltransferase domain-containing protein [Armatimonadota bacterium]|nr:phosphatidylglycerol lysyltransferase domain-containing protein [bacterium]